jgi:hypothetical protein
MPLVGLYLVNKVPSSFIHVYISKRQCMRDTGSDVKEFSILLKIYTVTLIVPPSFDTVHNFLSQITNSVVTLCSTKVYILLFCLACRTLHVDINRGVTEFDTHLILYL